MDMKLIIFLSFQFLSCEFGWCLQKENNINPEFLEPIKNVSAHIGANVDLSCTVKNLGNLRIIWQKLEEGREVFIGINSLKITTNPRVSVSLLQMSGDVTQSILYINGIKHDDLGVYQCAVNSDPLINQIGSVEELKDTSTHPPDSFIVLDSAGNVKACNSSECININEYILCIDFSKIWESAKTNANEFVSFLKSGMKKLSDLF